MTNLDAMTSSKVIESPVDTPKPYPQLSRGGTIVRKRWPSVRASAARKSGLSLSTGTKTSLNGGPPSSRKSRAKSGDLKIRSVSQVQTFFKERTLSKADAYIRDRTASEGHLFLKALAADAPFLEVRDESFNPWFPTFKILLNWGEFSYSSCILQYHCGYFVKFEAEAAWRGSITLLLFVCWHSYHTDWPA